MTAARSTAAPPEVIAGRYRIEAKLGQGGMGSVWRAQHLTLRSPVAIKLIDPALAQSEDSVARFLREAQAAASLRSPHVVQILDHGVDQGVPYIAMELLEGESLADRLLRTTKLSPADTARIMTHVARAMGRAHEAGIVHRDLKPDNVFLVRNDDEEIAKVLDFGIAKATTKSFDVTTGTRTGAMLGTPYYMSPEQVEGSKAIDHRTDLWAMAVIAFECLTGVRPFESDTLGALLLQICTKPILVPSEHAAVPPGFDAWFARATQRVPAERFQSAREMVDALRVALAEAGSPQPVLPTPPQGTPRTLTASGAAAAPLTAPAAKEVASVSHVRATGRHSRALPLWIAVGCLALLAAATLLFGRSRSPAKEAAAAPPPAVHPASVAAPSIAPIAAPAPASATGSTAAPPPIAPATPTAATIPKPTPAAESSVPRPTAAAPRREHAAAQRAKPEPVRPSTAAAAPTRVVTPAPSAAPAPKPAPARAKPADLGF
ncbi:MAG: serine/threonine-protein kinase [Polyangiales bacterium]